MNRNCETRYALHTEQRIRYKFYGMNLNLNSVLYMQEYFQSDGCKKERASKSIYYTLYTLNIHTFLLLQTTHALHRHPANVYNKNG